jgi:hypothetical protein
MLLVAAAVLLAGGDAQAAANVFPRTVELDISPGAERTVPFIWIRSGTLRILIEKQHPENAGALQLALRCSGSTIALQAVTDSSSNRSYTAKRNEGQGDCVLTAKNFAGTVSKPEALFARIKVYFPGWSFTTANRSQLATKEQFRYETPLGPIDSFPPKGERREVHAQVDWSYADKWTENPEVTVEIWSFVRSGGQVSDRRLLTRVTTGVATTSLKAKHIALVDEPDNRERSIEVVVRNGTKTVLKNVTLKLGWANQDYYL